MMCKGHTVQKECICKDAKSWKGISRRKSKWFEIRHCQWDVSGQRREGKGRDQKLRETNRKSLTGVCDKKRECRERGKQVRTKVLIIDQ